MQVFVASTADEASVNQREALLALGPWERDGSFGEEPAWRRGEVRLVTIREHHLYRDHLDRDLRDHYGEPPEVIVYLSKHRSESRTPSLTVHPIGNPLGADFGGKAGILVASAPRWMTAALRRLRKEAADLSYAVTYEATHHGPFLETPTFYIEQGSTEREWADVDASQAIARSLLDIEPIEAPVAIGLGGGHYAPRHSDVALARRIAFGHLLPAHTLDEAAEDVLAQAVLKTPDATLAYLHRKSFSKPEARLWEERLESLGIRVVREADLEPQLEAKTS